MRWTEADIPPLHGRRILITGANSGLGFESARALAQKGAYVIVASRSLEKASDAVARLHALLPGAELEPCALDLASLASVRAAAQAVASRHPHLDVLLNNAGVMATPYARTVDGFELQFATNHLGHFALTGLLFELLRKAPAARVVNVTSGAHRLGRMRFDDPHWEHGYARWPAYGTSKLANLLFTYELARRAQSAGLSLCSVAAHPGYAATNLQLRTAELTRSAWVLSLVRALHPRLGQPPERGALPQLHAATSGDIASGDFIGPDGLFEIRGYPRKVSSNTRSHDTSDMRRLWELSEQLTGVHYDLA